MCCFEWGSGIKIQQKFWVSNITCLHTVLFLCVEERAQSAELNGNIGELFILLTWDFTGGLKVTKIPVQYIMMCVTDSLKR